MVWRDEASLAAMALIHAASAGAMQALDDRIDTIAVSDAMTGFDAAIGNIVRPAMCAKVGTSADDWFKAYAWALRRIDPRLETLALNFVAISGRPALPQIEQITAERWSAPAWLGGPVDTIGSTIGRAATEIANRVVPNAVRERAEQVSARIVREIGERSGAHDRLRNAARNELSRVWLGPAPMESAGRPYLTHLLDITDRAARQAMEIIA
jgi:hypothetical protein